MNTNLLLALGCIKQAAEYVNRAEEELILDDLISECDEAIMALNNAVDKVFLAYSGVLDDVDDEYHGDNKRVIVEKRNPFIRVVK